VLTDRRCDGNELRRRRRRCRRNVPLRRDRNESVRLVVRDVLEHDEASFAHGDDADFEAELEGGAAAPHDDALAAPQLTAA